MSESSTWGCLLPVNDRYADIDLEDWEIWLGRNNECHPSARFDHIDISRKHCLISIELDEETGQYFPYIMDNSSNGTWVNGIQLEYGVKQMLKDKDKVTLAVPSAKVAEWDQDSIGYTFIDVRGRTNKKKNTATQDSSTIASSKSELTTQRHDAPAKKKKKKKKAQAVVEVEQYVEPEPEPEPQPQPKLAVSPLSVTVAKTSKAKSKASVEEEVEAEVEVESKPKAKLSSRPSSVVIETEEKPRRASGVHSPVTSGNVVKPEAPPSPSVPKGGHSSKTQPPTTQGLAEPPKSATPVKKVTEEELEAKARPKIGKVPKFEATQIELGSDSDDDEDEAYEVKPTKQTTPAKTKSSSVPQSGLEPKSSFNEINLSTIKTPIQLDDDDEEELEEEVHVIDENDDWLKAKTAVPRPLTPKASIIVRPTTSSKIGLKEKTMASIEQRRQESLREDEPISEDYLRKVTLIQCLYLRKLAKQRVKVESRRRNIAREMLTTERVYVKHLRAGLHQYALPLKDNLNNPKKKSIVTVDQYDKMFGDFEKIHEYNSKLLADLEPRVEKWSPDQCIGDIFCAIASEQTKAFRDIYASYIVCYDSAQRMFDRLAAASPAFINFVKEKEAAGKAQSILSCLIMPVQRLPRYKLLLSDLLRYTHPKHPDWKNLDMATKSIHEMTEYIDGAKDKADQLFRLFGTITPDNMSGAKKQSDKTKKKRDSKQRPMSAMFIPMKFGEK